MRILKKLLQLAFGIVIILEGITILLNLFNANGYPLENIIIYAILIIEIPAALTLFGNSVFIHLREGKSCPKFKVEYLLFFLSISPYVVAFLMAAIFSR